ncbi:MAG: alpha/beta hydrolase [Oscillospiraceae bacterium]|nr:alpha/beta hydrolase [Oscillospiraceae bacterium]
MIIIRQITIPQLTGKEKRRAYIYVPDEAKFNPEARYPVLYMFDGHNVFFDSHATYGKSWGMLEYLQENNVPLIVAAVECNHSPDNGRLSEYSPFDFQDSRFGSVKGRGRKTMEWYVKQFKPFIDRNFPTMPEREYTFISGSSMGGLMTIYAMTKYNHIFSRGAALSPSLWFNNDKLERMIRRAEFAPDTVLYMDYGSEEMGRRPDMIKGYNKIHNALSEGGVMVTSRIIPGGTHSEASWEKQLPFFLHTLFYNL